MKYLFLLAIALFALATIFGGCSLIPQTQYTHPADAESALEWPDGTVTQPGEQAWVDADGNGTAHEVDPETGEENQPLLVDDREKVEKALAKGEALSDNAPPPFNWIAKLILAAAGGGVMVFIGQRIKDKIGSAGGKPVPPAEDGDA